MAKKTAKPRQGTLGDIERGNPSLDALAEQHDTLGAEQKGIKADLRRRMKRLGKTHYTHGRVSITLTETESIRISVKIEKPVEPDEE